MDAAEAVEAAMPPPLHPYYPLGVPIPSYVANEMQTLEILSYFAVGCGAILLMTWFIARQVRPSMPCCELSTVMWFVFSGCIHLGMEGYVVFYNAEIAGMQTVLGQAWKEYSHSDSRYLTQDNFVITMEAVTAIFWGPLCLVIAYCILKDHPLRHPLQIIVCLGQIYGDILYFATCAWDHMVWETIYCVPGNFYFWCYFVFMNAVWLAIPFPLMISSIRACSNAFTKLKSLETGKKRK